MWARQRPFEPEHLAPAAASASVGVVEQGQQRVRDIGEVTDAASAVVDVLVGGFGFVQRPRLAAQFRAAKVIDRHV